MSKIMLTFAIIGAIVPNLFFAQFLFNASPDDSLVQALFGNGAAGGFTADVLITSVVFWLYLVHSKSPKIWAYVLINLTVGLSCALPLYLYFTLRKPTSASS